MFITVFFSGLRGGGGLIFGGYGRKFGSVMPVVFIQVEEEGYFFLGLVRGGAEFVGPAQFAFEGSNDGKGILA